MSILQSCGKGGDDHSNCFLLYLVRWISLGVSHHPCQCSKCCFFCSYVESMYFTSVDCKNIHNLKVKSYVLFSGNFEDFRPRRQHFKLKNLVLFCIPCRSKCQGSLYHSLDMHLSYLGPCILISRVSSEFTIGSGCSLMAARWQVLFSFLSFLRFHQLTLEGCDR